MTTTKNQINRRYLNGRLTDILAAIVQADQLGHTEMATSLRLQRDSVEAMLNGHR